LAVWGGPGDGRYWCHELEVFAAGDDGVAWTGERQLVWGGDVPIGGGVELPRDTGVVFQPRTRTWTLMAQVSADQDGLERVDGLGAGLDRRCSGQPDRRGRSSLGCPPA
jgi:hypothetical protein